MNGQQNGKYSKSEVMHGGERDASFIDALMESKLSMTNQKRDLMLG